jgi:hypothetical protein
MAERPVSDPVLAAALGALRREIDYPRTPPLEAAVAARLEADRARRARPRLPGLALVSRRRVLVLVAVGLSVALAAAFGARLVLGSAEVRIRPGVTPSGPPLVPGELGAPVSLAELAREVGFGVGLPDGPAPDQAHVVRTQQGEPAALVAWAAGDRYPSIPGTAWGLVVLQTRGPSEVTVKDVDRFEDLRRVRVHGRMAFWIDAPHQLVVITDDGPRSFAVRGNVLIWSDGAVTFRMETSLPLREAVALAESVG